MVANPRLREYVQDRLAGVVHTPEGEVVGPAGLEWKGRNKPQGPALDAGMEPRADRATTAHRLSGC